MPLHVNGEVDPLMKFIPKKFCAPLVVTMNHKMLWTMDEDAGASGQGEGLCIQDDRISPEDGSIRQNSGEESNTQHLNADNEDGREHPSAGGHGSDHRSEESSSASFEAPSVAEFLNRFMKPRLVKLEDGKKEKSDKDAIMPIDFNYHFLAYSSLIPPSVCEIGLFCMAEHTQVPLLMTSLLYQRRMWHIDEPLLGVGFSRYDTIVKLYIGWLDDSEESADCVMVSTRRLL